jgi:hypothetical protein
LQDAILVCCGLLPCGAGFGLGTDPGFFFFSVSLALTTILSLAKLPDFFGHPALERRQQSKRVVLPWAFASASVFASCFGGAIAMAREWQEKKRSLLMTQCPPT